MIERGVALRLTISAGVAVLPEDGSWLERLSVAADRSLHAAKGGGRNRVMTRAELAGGV
jgi:GGDEF domain-containing protein